MPTWAIVVAILVALRVLSIVVVLNSGIEDKHSILGGDARRYEAILATHGTPYRDFEVEYPPVTLGLVRLIGAGIDVSGIDPAVGEFDGDLGLLTRLAVVQLGFELGAAALLAWAWNRRTGIAYLILGTPFLLFPFPYVRIDLFAVFLAVLALSLVRKGMDRTGGVALGVAALAKLWPLVLAPLLIVTEKRRSLVVVGDHDGGRRRAVARVLRTGRPRTSRHVPRVEGLADREHPRRLLPHGRSRGEPRRTRRVAHGRRSPVDREAAVAPTRARQRGSGVVVGASASSPQRRHEDEWAVWGLAPLASILGLLVFSTIISPQYVLWFVPFVAIIAARGERLISGIYLVTAVLTTFILATIHGQIEGRLYATLPIVGRNFCLIAMLAISLYRLSPWNQRQTSRQPPNWLVKPALYDGFHQPVRVRRCAITTSPCGGTRGRGRW